MQYQPSLNNNTYEDKKGIIKGLNIN